MKTMRHIIYSVAVIFIAASLAACSDDEALLDANTIEGIGDITVSPASESTFLWKRAEDDETYAQFLRNLGVGYSYDAVQGRYCDWQDIRCQVLNRYFVEQFGGRFGENLLHTSTIKYSDTQYKFEHSLRDYVCFVNMETKEEINIGLYGEEKRTRSYFIEDGIQEKFYYILSEKNVMAQHYIDYASLLRRYDDLEAMFTQSFRNSIEHLNETDDDNFAAVDSFVNVWGTHVIVEAEIGAQLEIDLMNDLWRYQDQASDEEITSERFLRAVEENSSHSSSDDYVWLEHSRLNIDAKGGDQSYLTNLLGEHAPDGTRTFSTDGVSKWRNSIVYDPGDPVKSNVEMVGMTVIPIWEFASAIYPWVGMRIEAAITQDAALLRSILGDNNFFDASFPIRYTTAKCKYHQKSNWPTYTRTDSDSDPMIVNIESGGRYVATVCHEWINGKELWVCYPIYEGKVNLACGLGIDNSQKAYKVRWIKGKVTVTDTGDTADGTFYITLGGVGVKPVEGTTYASCTAYPYIELAGGVQPDGTFDGTAYLVKKDGETFYIDTYSTVDNFINFDRATSGRYIRNSNYTYIFNPNELR